ncbi:MAG: C40 family peptidase [Bacteroidota bacterium]
MLFRAAEAVVPLRREASESSEMVSQLLFGETVEKIGEKPRWWQVRCGHDGYEGWLDPKMVQAVTKEAPLSWHILTRGSLVLENDHIMPLPIGSRIPVSSEGMPQPFRISHSMLRPSKDLTYISHADRSELPTLACLFLYTPYLWGGRSGWGIDCSGFTQQVFAMLGISLPRDSSQQALTGTEVAWGDHQAGDLVFFSQQTDRVSHVGIILGPNKIIHASGRVRIDVLDPKGIIHTHHQDLTHNLLTIRRC